VAVFVALTLDLSINIGFNPTRSIIADVTPEGNPRTKGYTWMQTISGFWGVLAYVIGAYFGNYVLISIGTVIVFLFSIIPPLFITESRELAIENDAVGAASTQTEWAQLWRIYFAHGFSWVGVQTMFVYIIAFIQQHLISVTASPDAGAAQAGQIIAISFAVLNTVGFLLPAFVLEPLSEKMGRVRTHMICIGIMAAGYFLIGVAGTSPMLLYIFMAIVGIGWAAVVSLPFAIMTEKVDNTRTGFFMGIFNLSVVLPQLFVALVLGTIIQHAWDTSIIFMISGASLTISAILWCFVHEKKASV
jgi:MFS family permease